MNINLSPYRKAVLTAIGGLVTTVISFLVGDGADAATLGAAIMTLLTTIGVYRVTNEPTSEPTSAIESSPHVAIDLVPTSVTTLTPGVAPKPRKAKASTKNGPVAKKAAKATTRKSGE